MERAEGIDRGGRRLVGVIADTHADGLAVGLPPAFVEALSGSDLILHAGDIDGGWAPRPSGPSGAPSTDPGVREVANGFVLARLAARFQGRADCVVFGHTHIPTASRLGPTLYVNPGDAQYCTQRLVHIGLLHIEPAKPIRAELVALDLSR